MPLCVQENNVRLIVINYYKYFVTYVIIRKHHNGYIITWQANDMYYKTSQKKKSTFVHGFFLFL